MRSSMPADHDPWRAFATQRLQRGFSLIELIAVIIVIGVLAAIAVPRFIALGRDARMAAVKAMTGTITSAAANFHALCRLDPSCDYTAQYQASITVGGVTMGTVYGWPNSGGQHPSTNEIEGLIDFSGFSVVHANPTTTFTFDGAPSPANCSVSYLNPYLRGSDLGPLITTDTSGC